MIVSFPHMGHMHITLKALFRGLGAEVQMPPPLTKKTIELGVKYAPETVCLPFKVTLGSFIEALERGADTLVTCGGNGPCRLGFYAQLQKNILQEQGYTFEMIAVEPKLWQALSCLRVMPWGRQWRQVYHAFRLAGSKMAAIDRMEETVRFLRPRVESKSRLENLWHDFLSAIDQAENGAAVADIEGETAAKLAILPVDEQAQPLRIAVVGEIYAMLEPFVNHRLDIKLAELGVEVLKAMSLTEYVRVHLLRSGAYRSAYQAVLEAAKPYLGHYVGGHGIKTVGCAALGGRKGYDGIIQVFPFTCMPEVIAKNILPAVSDDTGIPVLSLVFDEQSGEAGMLTRLEAYTDLLRYRKAKWECR